MPFLLDVKGLNRFAGLKFNGLKVFYAQTPNPKHQTPNTKRIIFGTMQLLCERNPQPFELIELLLKLFKNMG